MSQATVQGRCEQCHENIEIGQPVVTLHKAAFHGPCLIVWCERNLNRKQQLAETLRESV